MRRKKPRNQDQPKRPGRTGRRTRRRKHMATKIIVSYDGTANEDDAIALGRPVRPRRRRGCRSPTCATTPRPTACARRSHRPRRRSCSTAAPSCSATPAASATSSPTARPREGLAALAERPGRRGDRVLLGLAHGQGPRGVGNSAAAPARGRLHRGRDRARRTSPSAHGPAARHGSSRSATATAVRARRPRRSRARSARRSRRSSTTTPACS